MEYMSKNETKELRIRKVTNAKEMDDFVHLPLKLYKGNPYYVPDMLSDVRNSLNPKKNIGLAYADVQPFVAYRGEEPVGRIVAVISHKSNEIWNRKNVRFSLVEFIDDEEVANALMDAVADFGRQHGMDTVEGPMGITDFDKEGMLIEDFEKGGTFMEIWNPEYYPKHMERMGFGKAADWLQIRIDVPQTVPSRYKRVADYARQEFGLRIVHKTAKDIYNGYGQKVFKLFNEAYAPLFGFAPFSEEQIDEYCHAYVPLLDFSLIPFIETPEGELVGAAVLTRDFSEGLRKSKGKLLPFGWYHLIKALKLTKSPKAQLMLIGVKPEMQGMGVNALIFDYLIPLFNEKGITWCETGPQLDTNTRELGQWAPLHPTTLKRRRCWTKSI